MPLDPQELAARYGDIIAAVETVGAGTARKTRFVLRDGSYIGVQFSASGRYSYHWERRHVDGKLYRFDNAPHHFEVATFPHHLHDGSEEKVVESRISARPEEGVPQVLDFARAKLRGQPPNGGRAHRQKQRRVPESGLNRSGRFSFRAFRPGTRTPGRRTRQASGVRGPSTAASTSLAMNTLFRRRPPPRPHFASPLLYSTAASPALIILLAPKVQ